MNERRRRILLGAALHAVSHTVAVIYCVVTLHQPNRSLMLAAYLGGMASGLVGVWAARRVTTQVSGYRLSFTILLITLLTAALGAHWDGGVTSPAALGFVTTTVFVANYTPHLRVMIALELLVFGSYLVVAVTGGPTRPGYVFIHVAGMLVLASVCSAQARSLARQRSQLRALAALDPLTGALNRRGLAEFTSHLFRGGCRPGPSLLCLDLDDFKLVNDRLGHAAGDELLRRTVAAARDVLRVEDAIARVGGDEFVVVLVDAEQSIAASIASRIDAAVRQHTGVSIGAATAPYDGDTLDALMAVADQRLYRVKQERHRAAAQSPGEGHGLVPSGSDTVGAP
ncbi:GGDEF domain-containing protein [Micromonospora sp. LZ34]